MDHTGHVMVVGEGRGTVCRVISQRIFDHPREDLALWVSLERRLVGPGLTIRAGSRRTLSRKLI
jgi:hypothetical protein